MKPNFYLDYLVHDIHTTIMATSDEEGQPVTCAVDMMDCDNDSLFFLTAKGKSLYHRLKRQGFLALTGLKGDSTMTSVAISLRGKVREVGREPLESLIEKNPYMREIYPTEESRKALSVFQIYEGTGEWFDLSKKPIERADFTFGGAEAPLEGYFITEKCVNCGLCLTVCPQSCIDLMVEPAAIIQMHCIRCGNCREICPVGAVRRLDV